MDRGTQPGSPDEAPPTGRREFLGIGLALGASAAVVAAGADDPKPKAEAAKKDEPKPDEKSEADARMEIVLTRYGPQLDADARRAVRREIEMITRRAEGLRKFALENGDGPFPVFHPYRAPLGKTP
ncbi:MAG: hypothetical protein U0835_21560 [Isosphaeraceae bacterium]